ncbi:MULTISPECIES: hypothetical protein [Enterococcus]|uniref:Uncharacterized protein n=2 Tax=Bacilli TaxID=91061 RepID=A0A640MH54_BACAN|nr:hypothetical protein [Enterococcus faecalis]GEU13026.1 hypothetical protein QuyetLC_54640 [Bacillus anthracis]MDN3143301.1 hypothetical protein [Enterococcus faecalis]MDN3191597.1 hypothetical protein [Enterococcus faecalis]MEB6011106.1 hypothetical protein [Enterococcus faecalis]WPH46154.1 hypothetical protein SHT67_09815 [Enterococcus faecalis]
MKMLDLLNDDNIKKAITYLLNLDLEESESYKQKQRFTKLSTEDELPKIDYISQKEHAIDWIFSKTLWHKAKNNGSIDLSKLINDIQCTPLLLYLAIVVDLITEDDAENYINEITDKLEECSNITSKNVRFKEKKALINVIGENWSKAIANKLIQ